MEPRRGRRRVLTLSCIFGKEKNQEVLIFFFFFGVFFVFGRDEKSSDFVQAESRTQEVSLFFFGSQNLAVHQSVHYPGFGDISAF